MTERIGSDVLGAQERTQQQTMEKKKRELLKKIQEEKAKKKMSDDLQGKQVPGEGVPGEHAHERKPGEGYDVSVREHRRRKPKKRKSESVEQDV